MVLYSFKCRIDELGSFITLIRVSFPLENYCFSRAERVL